MNKKFISLIMAALLAVSAVAVSASAVETDKKTAGAEVSAETVADEDKKTFFFDSKDWHSSQILFYIWDSTTGEYATSNRGWVTDNTWGSKNKLRGTAVDGQEGKFESYEVDLSGRENDAVYVIFQDPDSTAQTFNAIINSSVYGHTATLSDTVYENPEDSNQTARGVTFDGGSGVGIAKVITSIGTIQGDIIHPSVDPAQVVADYVFKYQSNDAAHVTPESVQNAIAEFGTDKNTVWERYTTTKSSEPDYADKEARGRELILGEDAGASSSTASGASSSTASGATSSTASGSSSSGSTSSKASGSTTTAAGSTGTTTATTGGSTGTTTATGSSDTAATGDTRGVVAFAGVLVAAAGTIVATRKKIED